MPQGKDRRASEKSSHSASEFESRLLKLATKMKQKVIFEPQKPHFQVSNKIMMLLVAFVPYTINLKACEIG